MRQNISQTAIQIEINRNTLAVHIKNGNTDNIPPFYRLGGRIYFDSEVVEQWLKERTTKQSSEVQS